MTEATVNRCTYTAAGLRCIREAHPDHPHAHVRVSGTGAYDAPGDLIEPEAA